MSEQSQDTTKRTAGSANGPTSDRRRRRRPETPWGFIVAIAAVAAVAAATSSASPTGIGVFDVVQRAAFGFGVTLFAACSRRWAWLLLAGMATVLAASLWVAVLGGVALGFAVHAAWRTDTRDRTTGALIGALSAQALLRTADVGFFGLTAVLVAVTVIPVAVSGYRTMRRRNRRRIDTGLITVVLFVIVATAGFAYSAFRAAEPIDYGITSAKRGLDVATTSDQVGAAGHWTNAHNSFAEADSYLSSPLAKLAYAVPVLSQHAQLAATAATSGASITETAARAATVAPYQRLRAADGTFDLARISAMEDPVRQTAVAMRNARDDVDTRTNSWILELFRDRVGDYRSELVRAIPQAESALEAIEIAPEVLGGNGPRSYLVLFGNPAETRGLGGFIGAWAQLDASEGKLELVRHGKMGELNDATDPASRQITGEEEYLRRYGYLQPARFIQNISASPDFPTVARVAQQLYPQAGGTEVDGVMYVDPTALAALLELTGPVLSENIPMPLTSENAADFLMHDQYVDIPGIDDRTDVLSDAAEATFDALTSRELPSIATITSTMSPMMHNRNIMAVLNDADAGRYVDRIGLTGAFPPPEGSDFAAVTISNGSQNKVDYFVTPIFAYAVAHDPETGGVSGSVSGQINNGAPVTGGPTYVFGNQDTRAGSTDGRPFASTTLRVSVYSALRPTAMRIDGEEVPMQVQRELGTWVATQTVTIPAQSQVIVQVDVEGDFDPAEPYRVTLLRQPTAQEGGLGARIETTGARGTPRSDDPTEFLARESARRTVTVSRPVRSGD